MYIKLYERCLLERLENNLSGILHPLQGGFRKGIGCNMTSFLLRESIIYSNENGSNLYACFLDARQAFDRVWHDGLFYKLYKLNVPMPLLANVIAMHTSVTSCVLYKGFYSDWFSVLQGTRQGGVWSPFLYLCYINDLIKDLVALDIGFSIADDSYCAPTVADDMLLLSLSRKSLQVMLKLCYRYSCLWRYQYNASKCAVVVFKEYRGSESRCDHAPKMYLGEYPLSEVTSYKHLGITCDRGSRSSLIVKECCDKIRGTFFSLVNYGFNDDGLQPLTCKHIYNAVVIPKALYGSECWPSLTKTDMLAIERAHRLCLKYIQGLSARTSTDIVLSLVDSLPIEYEIDKRKLILFGQLCRLDTNCAIKRMFLYKLCSFEIRNVSSGFIPEVVRILDKYGLRCFLTQYVDCGSFPDKFAWKKLVKGYTKNTFVSEWNARTSRGAFERFRVMHKNFGVSFLWNFSKLNTNLLSVTKVVAQLTAYLVRFDTECSRCEQSHSCNFTDHLLLDCSFVSTMRNAMYLKLESKFGLVLALSVKGLPRHELVNTLLGLWHPVIEESLLRTVSYNKFVCTVYKCVYAMYRAHPSTNNT
jgi:hypothetical protein